MFLLIVVCVCGRGGGGGGLGSIADPGVYKSMEHEYKIVNLVGIYALNSSIVYPLRSIFHLGRNLSDI